MEKLLRFTSSDKGQKAFSYIMCFAFTGLILSALIELSSLHFLSTKEYRGSWYEFCATVLVVPIGLFLLVSGFLFPSYMSFIANSEACSKEKRKTMNVIVFFLVTVPGGLIYAMINVFLEIPIGIHNLLIIIAIGYAYLETTKTIFKKQLNLIQEFHPL